MKPLLSTSSSTSSDINQQNIIQSHDVFNELEENFKLKSREQTLSNDSGSIRRNTNINNSLTKYSKFDYFSEKILRTMTKLKLRFALFHFIFTCCLLSCCSANAYFKLNLNSILEVIIW